MAKDRAVTLLYTGGLYHLYQMNEKLPPKWRAWLWLRDPFKFLFPLKYHLIAATVITLGVCQGH